MPGSEREDPRYDEWPLEDHDPKEMNYLGLVSGGSPYFHHDDSNTIYRGTVDDAKERIRLSEDTEHAGEALGDVIESIGDRTGWESLSEFAQEHLEDEEGSSSDS
jgi:hypothetical protein